MKKTLCALAVGTTLFSPVITMAADVKVYGRAHVSLDYIDNGKDYNDVGFSSNSSRLGIKAEHNVTDDLTVFGQIEQTINFSSGSDSEDINFATRDTFVGLKHDQYGQVRLGRFDSPFKAARGPVNIFGDMVGDIRNLTRVGDARFDERNSNTFEYKSPKIGNGFNVLAAISMNSGTEVPMETDGKAQKNNKAYDLAASYKEGPIDLTAAYEHYDENASNARKAKRNGIRVAGSYQINDELQLGALYQNSKFKDDALKAKNAQVYGLTGEYKISAKTLVRGEYIYRNVKADDSNASMIALGLEHRVASPLRFYGNIATVMNDQNSDLTPWKEGRSFGSSIKGAKDKNATALSLGMRYDF